MSHPPIEQPKVTRRDQLGVTYTHPAYGTIRASRISGSTVLFGSDFIHHHYVLVEISEASKSVDLATDRIHGAPHPIVRVLLSEAQWATFVSTLNMGSGTPCTIDYRERDGQVAELPPPEARTAAFEAASLELVEDIIARVETLRRAVADNGKLPIKVRETMELELRVIRDHLHSNIPYIGKVFTEHVENVTEAARIELNAYLTQVVQRAGIKALQGAAAADVRPIELPAGLRGDDESEGEA